VWRRGGVVGCAGGVVSRGVGEVVSMVVPAAWSSCFRGGVERSADGVVSKGAGGVVSECARVWYRVLPVAWGPGVTGGWVEGCAGGVVWRSVLAGLRREVPAYTT